MVIESHLASLRPDEGEESARGQREWVGRLTIAAEGCTFGFPVDRIAYESSSWKGTLLAFSGAGGPTEVKAVRAAIHTPGSLSFRFSQDRKQGGRSKEGMSRDPDGYTVQIKSLGLKRYHIVAVARRHDFLVNACSAALWRYLRNNTSTPILRTWLDAISSAMLMEKRMFQPAAFGPITPALVHVDDAYLDELVVRLLRSRSITIPKEK